MKFHYLDHDSDVVDMIPPVQNTWYEVFRAYDVRLLWCQIYQTNDEAAIKDIEVRWTIDGTVYFVTVPLASATFSFVYRAANASAGGTSGLTISATDVSAARYVDKRGQDFKVEVRITSALGTNQRLMCRCVRETLELT